MFFCIILSVVYKTHIKLSVQVELRTSLRNSSAGAHPGEDHLQQAKDQGIS